ncbi:MAG: hypothetical protein QXT24_04005 [Thermoplasmatales archaeon]
MIAKKSIPVLATILFWNIPLLLRSVIFDTYALLELLVIEIAVLTIFAIVTNRIGIFSRFMLILSFLSLSLCVFAFISGMSYLAPFYLLSGIIGLRYGLNEGKRDDLIVSSLSFAILITLLFISSSLRIFLHSAFQDHIFLFSIYDNAQPAGVPITYSLGIILSSGRVTLTISPLILVFFPAVAYLASANTVLIVRSTTPGTSIVPTAVTALACQCENTVGIISGTASYLALAIVPYLVFLSVAMLLATNFFLHRPRRLPKIKIGHRLFLFLFLISMIVESFLVFSGLILNLWIFGLNSILTLFSGFFLGQLVPFRRKEPVPLIALAFIIQLSLLIPPVVSMALVSPIYFEIYAFAGIISGLLISLALRNRGRISRIGIIELVFSMEAMLSVIFLYLSLNSVTFFPRYSQIAVLSFSLFLLLVSIPVMWFSNIFLLSARFFGA